MPCRDGSWPIASVSGNGNFLSKVCCAHCARDPVGTGQVGSGQSPDQDDAAHEKCGTFKAHELSSQSAIRTERTENCRRSKLVLDSSCSRYSAISLQSAEAVAPKNDSKSVAYTYETRTKSAKTNGPRKRIS